MIKPQSPAIFLLLALFFLTPNTRALAQVDPDLVIPQAGDADQDAISAEKQNEADVNDKDAQSRKTPKEEDHYLRLMPAEDVDKPPELQEKLKNGTKVYKTKIHEQKYAAGVRVGPFDPTNLQGDQPGITYKEIYGSGAIEADFFFEYQFMQSFGKLGAKADLGLFTAKGNGRFLHTPTLQANETITLLGLPVSASLDYHMQYWRKQLFIPYGEIGADYIPFFELRSDLPKFSDNVKYGGAPAWHAAGGVLIQLDFMDQQGVWQLYEEYGITHIYLTFDLRQVFGLSSTFDFTSLIYEGGVAFEF